MFTVTFGPGTPISTTVPPRRDRAHAWSSVADDPTQSNTTSTPIPWVSSATAPATSSAGAGSNVCVAPQRTASSRLPATGSRTINGQAPLSLAPWAADRPIPPAPMISTLGLDRRQVQRRAGAGDHGATEEAEELGGQVGAHRHGRLLADDDGLGERAQPGRATDRGASLDERAAPRGGGLGAQVRLSRVKQK